MPSKFFNYNDNDEDISYLSNENLRFFASDILSRGEEYFRQGRVKITYSDIEKGEFHANVAGSEVYAVRLDFKGHLLSKASCNCPYAGRGHCKHEAALLYEINEDFSSPLDTDTADVTPKKEVVSSLGIASSVTGYESKLYSFARSLPDTESGEKSFFLAAIPYFEGSSAALLAFAPEMLSKLLMVFNANFQSAYDSHNIKVVTDEFSKVFFGSPSLKGIMNRFLKDFDGTLASLCFNEFLLNEKLKGVALETYRASLSNERRYGWASLIYTSFSNNFDFFAKLDDVSEKLTQDSLSFGGSTYDNFVVSVVHSGNVHWLVSLIKAHGVDIIPNLVREEAIHTLMENGERSYGISLSLASLGYCSFESFMKIFHTLSPEEREENSSRLESIARMSRFYNSYSLISSPIGIRGYSFTGIPVYDLPLLTVELDSSDPSFAIALRKKLDPMVARGLENASPDDFDALLKLIEMYPFLKDYLLNSSLESVSFRSAATRLRYLSIVRKYSLFASLGLRRYN